MTRSLSRNTILIAEDDPNIASLVSVYLQNEGFKTLVASDDRQALTLAKQQPLRFVILDLMLPHLDGWEVCRELRRVSDVPILILSAREDELDRVLGLSLGADDYVVKPFSPRELVARVSPRRMLRPLPSTGKRSRYVTSLSRCSIGCNRSLQPRESTSVSILTLMPTPSRPIRINCHRSCAMCSTMPGNTRRPMDVSGLASSGSPRLLL